MLINWYDIYFKGEVFAGSVKGWKITQGLLWIILIRFQRYPQFPHLLNNEALLIPLLEFYFFFFLAPFPLQMF